MRKPAPRRPFAVEALEARDVPAVTVQFDFTLDTAGLFNDPARRAVLQQAADDLTSHLDTALPAVAPSGDDHWTATFADPGTGAPVAIPDPVLAADTLVVYVGGRSLGGGEAGQAEAGRFSASGSQDWIDSLQGRGPGGTLVWGGSIAFDAGTNWWFGSAAAGMAGNQVDFYSVAVHELGHVLGIGTSLPWNSLAGGGFFTGPAAQAVFGGPVPLSADGGHWADGVRAGGQPAAFDSALSTGTRVPPSALDFAGLQDLGWTVSLPANAPSSNAATQPASDGLQPVVLTGPTDGSARVFHLTSGGTLAADGGPIDPFPGFTGVVRSTVADFNGDGVPDYAFATGPGTAAAVRIIDGATRGDLLPPTPVFEGFPAGLFVAAGDVDGDGRAELAVSADAGGGTRVSVLGVAGGRATTLVDFLAFDDPAFRGGSRVAMGDINHDGVADLVVGAGLGGAPRVAVYDGGGLVAGRHDRLVPDFFALDPALRSGVYVTAADLDADGFSDLVYCTGDSGGPRVRVVSGALLMASPGADVASLPAMADFFALDPADRHGIRIAARDLDGDGQAELIVGSGDPANATVRIIPRGEMLTPTTPLQDPFTDPVTIDGVYVG